MRKIIWMLCLLWLMTPLLFAANADLYNFEDPAQAQRFQQLTKTFRCVVCQNQSLADSNAPLAKDLRDKIYQLVGDNKTDQEIESFLVERYGDYVLFKPRFTSKTMVLWLFPLAGILIAFWMVFRFFIRPYFNPSF